MDAILKTVKDYTDWKNNLKSVLDNNLIEIINLITDSCEVDTLITIKTIPIPIQYPFVQQFNNIVGQQYIQQLNKAFLVNINQNTGEKMIWFFDNTSFFLINHGANTSLNISPKFKVKDDIHLPLISGCFIARFDNQIDFLLSFLDWLPELEKILLSRMERVDPKTAASKIDAVISTIK